MRCRALQGHYGDAVALINRSEVVMCQGEPLPIDLRVRRGEAHIVQLYPVHETVHRTYL